MRPQKPKTSVPCSIQYNLTGKLANQFCKIIHPARLPLMCVMRRTRWPHPKKTRRGKQKKGARQSLDPNNRQQNPSQAHCLRPKMMKNCVLLWVGVLCAFLGQAVAASKMSLVIPAFATECIYHDLFEEQESLIIGYQVLTGGNFELNFRITSPSGESIIEQKNEKYADFVLKTFGLGGYSFCFSNPYKDMKRVEFSIALASEAENDTPKTEDVVADHALSEIDRNINKIEKIMNYLRAREWRNMSTVESTQSRTVYLSIAVIVLTVGVSFAQATIVQILFSGREKNYV